MKPFTKESALLWATGRCAQRECCLSEISKKLKEGGLDADTIESVLNTLVDEQYIDETRYARAFIHDKLEYDHWGRIKMTAALRLKGISRSDIESAMTEVVEEQHYRDILRTILKSKIRTLSFDADDREEAYKASQKLVRSAASRGFEPDIIFEEVDNLE